MPTHRHLLAAGLTLAGLACCAPTSAMAQGPSLGQAAALLRLDPPGRAERPDPDRGPLIPPDSSSSERKDHTVTGLLIGAGLGFVAGWAFYDAICEAVDNRCSDSRVSLVVLGTASGAGIGALLGSLAR